jgi:hypothetical protein
MSYIRLTYSLAGHHPVYDITAQKGLLRIHQTRVCVVHLLWADLLRCSDGTPNVTRRDAVRCRLGRLVTPAPKNYRSSNDGTYLSSAWGYHLWTGRLFVASIPCMRVFMSEETFGSFPLKEIREMRNRLRLSEIIFSSHIFHFHSLPKNDSSHTHP